MKFVRFGPAGYERPGVLDEAGSVRDLSSVVADIDAKMLAEKGMEAIAKTDLSLLPIVEKPSRYGSCIGGVGNFIAVGLNYADHAAETGAAIPSEPILFNKAPSCIVGAYDDIVIPRGAVKVDWEVELAIVIGKPASYVAAHEALDFVAGYCICNDVSEREYQLERGGTWTKGKSCPTFGPLGPWLVTPDEIDLQNLALWLDVNQKRMQTGSTATMIFNIPQIVSYISHFMLLNPGDVITTGTPPGVGMALRPPRYLQDGDVVALGITGLGQQRQRVVKFEGSVLESRKA